MAKELHVEYVGKKPVATEHLSGRGIQWRGKGDIQPVPEKYARQLAENYPDQWHLSESQDGDVTSTAEALAILTNSKDAPKAGKGRRAKAAAQLAALINGEPEAPKQEEAAPAEVETAAAEEAPAVDPDADFDVS